MKITALNKDEVYRSLATAEGGLAEAEARRRLAESGPNEIERGRRTPLPVRLLRQFTHFLAILLWIAAGLSFFSEYLKPGEGMLNLGIAIVAVIVINALFTFIQEYRAEKAMEEMRKMLPFEVNVLREGKVRELDARELVPGDIVLLEEGDKVPADARVIEESDLKVNNAALTGESEPLPRTAGPDERELLQSANIIFAGTTVVNGNGKGAVFATGMRTEFGRIAHLTGSVTAGLSPLQREIIRLTRIIAVLALSIGIVFFIAGYFLGRPFWQNFFFAIGVIVALVPEGLFPTVTLSLAMGSQRIAKKKALMKSLASVETLGSVTVICTDKTGTLTENRMSVKRVFEPGKGDPSLMHAALFCNNAKEVDGGLKGDPTEVALYRAALEFFSSKGPGVRPLASRVKEFPFDPERKRMSTVHEIRGKRYLLAKGAPESVFEISTDCIAGEGLRKFDECMKEEVEDTYNSFMDEGLRVLAFAYRELEGEPESEPKSVNEAERDMIFLGLIGLEDPPRPEVKDAIAKCRDSGIRLVMITGDSARTALAIGKEIGLARGELNPLESAEMEKMPDAELYKILSQKEVILARMTPEHKLRVVNVLKDRGERVAVTGDGVNDAPALKRADIGIAMGITGTDVAKEAADMVLMDDNFATIINAIEEGKAVFENIRKFTSYVLTSNGPELAPYILYILFFIPLPLTIMQILAIDLGTDMFPALALGAERPTPAIIKKPPRSPKEHLINAPLLTRVFLFLGVIEAAAGLFGYFYIMHGAGWHWGEQVSASAPFYMQATTACLCGIIMGQIGAVFACRSYKESVFKIGFFSNKLLFLGIAIEIAIMLVLVYTPFGHRFFATCPLLPYVFLLLAPFGVFLFLADEARKWAVRKITKSEI
jgi:sodium/potassium-transporting ATPase subunit alpha